MKISLAEAEGQLAELVRRAEAGDEIILTRDGQPAVSLMLISTKPIGLDRRRILEAARESGRQNATSGPNAARSQDFLYGDGGGSKR